MIAIIRVMFFAWMALLRRNFFSLCVAFCAMFFLAGCGEKASQKPVDSRLKAPVHAPRVLARDDLGREIALPRMPRRIVTIGPGATEIVFALGLGNHLVARDERSDFPAAAKKLPVAGDFNGPNLENVLAARADFLVVQGETYGRTRIENWQKQLGVPVASLSATTLQGMAEDVRKMASWLDAKNAAAPLLQRFAALPKAREYSQAKKPAAFFEVGRAPLWTAGKNTLIDDVMRAAGIENAAAEISGYKAYSLETLQTRRIDFYIATAATTDEAARQNILRELRAQPGLRDLSCIKRGRVIVLNADEVLRPGPRLLDGIAQLRREVEKAK